MDRDSDWAARIDRKWRSTHRPFVTLKFAATLDGKIATSGGESRWISGEEALRYAHVLRHNHDAIAVGINTVLVDDPELTTRHLGAGARQPLRVVLDSRLRIPLNARLLDPSLPGATIVACCGDPEPERALSLESRGATVLRVPGEAGRVDAATLLACLAERGVRSLLVEGGGEVHAAFLTLGLADRVEAVIAPMLVGGRTARTPVEGEGVARLADAVRLREVEVRPLGGDLLITGNVERGVGIQ